MLVSLVSPYESVINYGLRCLSALLKANGINTRMIFLPRETEGYRKGGFRHPYPQAVLDQVSVLAKGSDLVGISVMSNYFFNAIQLTEHLKKSIQAPIIWGGVHPSIRPEESLEHADLVCLGEAEDALMELVQRIISGGRLDDIDSIWSKRNGEVIRTPLRKQPNNLDLYPSPDYDLEDHYVLHKGQIRPMTEDLLMYYLRWPYAAGFETNYITMMSRGCTYSCTYCINNAIRMIFGKGKVRRRSVDNLIAELVAVTKRYPGIKMISVEDDVFLDDVDILEEFCRAYKEKIKLPLFVKGFQPAMVDERKVAALVEAGMTHVRTGIQTGSMQTLHEVYKRPGSMTQFTRAFQVFYKFRDRLKAPIFDLIVDNPYESPDDEIKTIRMFASLPRPYELSIYSLTFYPGTELYERARSDGLIKNEYEEIYEKDFVEIRRTYNNGLFRLLQLPLVPAWIVRMLAADRIRKLNWIWLPYTIHKIFYGFKLAGVGVRVLLRGDFAAFGSALRARVGFLRKTYN